MSTYVQGKYGAGTGTALTVTFDNSVTAGNNILVLLKAVPGASPITDVSDNKGNGAYTLDKHQDDGGFGNFDDADLFSKLNIATGGSSFQVTVTGSAGGKSVRLIEFSITGTCSLDGTALGATSGTGTAAATVGGISTSGSDNFSVSNLAWYQSGGNPAAPAGWTALDVATGQQNVLKHSTEYRTDTGTFTSEWGSNTCYHVIITATYKGDGGGGTAELDGASTVPAFTSSAAVSALEKIAGVSGLGSFGSAAAAKGIPRLTGASNIAAVASSASVKALEKLAGACAVAAFVSSGAVSNVSDPGTVHGGLVPIYTRRRRGR